MELTSTQTGLFGFQNEVQIEVNTIGLEKANIIAIYENETVFNGHYQKQERMNIIQLYVNDDTPLEGTPFVEGPNAIVIPSSLFLETILNKKIQDDQLNETALYAEEKCEFLSIERNGETEEACEEVDFVFVRFDISSEDAMEVLELLVTCLINETTNQTEVVYKYMSTKLNGTSPVLINLPHSALGFVPWLCNYENSNQGRTPHNFEEWVKIKIVELANFILGLVVAIWTLISEIWEDITEYIGEILMENIPWLGKIIWLIIRAIIFIITWISFALSLFVMIFVFLAVIALVILLDLFLNLNIVITAQSINVDGDFELEFDYNINFEYIDYFDLILPILIVNFDGFGFGFEYSTSLFGEKFNITKTPADLFSNISSSNPNPSIINLRKSGESSSSSSSFTLQDGIDLVTGVGIAMSLAGTIVTTVAAFKTMKHDKKLVTLLTIISFIAFLITLTVFLSLLFTNPSYWLCIGLGIGFMIAGVIFIVTARYIDAKRYYMDFFNKRVGQKKLFKAAGIIDLLLTLFGIALDIASIVELVNEEEGGENNILDAVFALSAGILAMLIAVQCLIMFGGHDPITKENFHGYTRDDKVDVSLTFGIITFLVGATFIVIAEAFLQETT